MIQLFDFEREYGHLGKDISRIVNRVIETGWYILGNSLSTFEKNFASYLGANYASGVGNGYDALLIALKAVGVEQGDEVITCSHSFVASSLPILALGAKPVFVDIDEYYHLDPSKIEAAITPKTKVILPIHLYGQICNIEEICQIAKKHSLFVIEDACQAHGAKKDGVSAGCFGDIGCFSFYPTKNLGAYGDAGAVVTQSEELHKKIRALRNYGQEEKYHHTSIGLNSRMDEIQAAILDYKLQFLDEFVSKRRELANLYRKYLQDCAEITLPQEKSPEEHAYHLFVIEAEQRDALAEFLGSHDVQTLIHYPTPIHRQPAFKDFSDVSVPNTEKSVERILSLPIHQYMTHDEVKEVCEKIISFYEKKQDS